MYVYIYIYIYIYCVCLFACVCVVSIYLSIYLSRYIYIHSYIYIYIYCIIYQMLCIFVIYIYISNKCSTGHIYLRTCYVKQYKYLIYNIYLRTCYVKQYKYLIYNNYRLSYQFQICLSSWLFAEILNCCRFFQETFQYPWHQKY